jgi:hypothetical protein
MADIFDTSGADYFGAAKSLLGGVSGFQGGNAQAQTANTAAQTYANAARLSLASTQIKEAAASRGIYQSLGGIRAAAGGNGLNMGGSAEDVIRDSAHQGAIAKSVIGLQGQIDYNSFMAQSSSEAAKAASAKSGGMMSTIGSIVGIAGAIFSDDDLKDDVELVRRRADGLGIYKFRYKGSAQVFEGAMASEVEELRPDAIWYDADTGLRMVDYDRIKMPFRVV